MAKKYTAEIIADLIEKKLLHHFGIATSQASDEAFYKATVLVLIDIMRERRTAFKKETSEKGAKTVYYLSMEFLMGRSLKNNLFNFSFGKTPLHTYLLSCERTIFQIVTDGSTRHTCHLGDIRYCI